MIRLIFAGRTTQTESKSSRRDLIVELSNNGTASQAVVEKVAQQEGVDPAKLETPLHEAVDGDALDKLVSSMSSDGVVRFEYHEYWVSVTGDGRVEVSEEDAPTP